MTGSTGARSARSSRAFLTLVSTSLIRRQLLAQPVHGPRDRGLHGSQGPAQNLGGLGLRQVFEIPQHHGRSLPGPKPQQDLMHGPPFLRIERSWGLGLSPFPVQEGSFDPSAAEVG